MPTPKALRVTPFCTGLSGSPSAPLICAGKSKLPLLSCARQQFDPQANHQREQIMICDVLVHYIPKNFSDFMGDRFPPRVGVPVKAGIAKHRISDSAGDIIGRLELMDAAGVEKQVLSPHRRRIWRRKRSASEQSPC